MEKKHEIQIDGIRIRKSTKESAHYKFEFYKNSWDAWVQIRTNSKLHRQIMNRNK